MATVREEAINPRGGLSSKHTGCGKQLHCGAAKQQLFVYVFPLLVAGRVNRNVLYLFYNK